MAKLNCKINPIRTLNIQHQQTTSFSLLNKSKKKKFNLEIPYKDGLDDCLKRLGKKKK